MRNFIIAALLLITLSACATTSGNYTKISDADYHRMARDTVRQLTVLYPPASTRLRISQSTTDAYGQDLIKKLRTGGYALQETSQLGDWFRSNFRSSSAQDTSEKPSHKSSVHAAKSLSYVVDQIGDDLYRVTITVDNQILSRVYETYGRHMVSAGSWTRKE